MNQVYVGIVDYRGVVCWIMGAWIEVSAETPLCWQVSSAGAQSTNRIHIVSLARYNFSKDTKGIWKANRMSGLRNNVLNQFFNFRFTWPNLAVYALEVKICEVFVVAKDFPKMSK